MSATQSLFHIVINTYRREMTIDTLAEEHLFRYIWKYLQDRHCKLLRINGIPNHIHIFADIHPTESLSELVGEMKRRTSIWMKNSGMFPQFKGWGKEYFAVSKSNADKNTVIEYIKNQKEHHRANTFEDEIKRIIEDHGLGWNDNMLT